MARGQPAAREFCGGRTSDLSACLDRVPRLLNRNQWYQVRPRSTTPGLKKSGKTSLCCKLTPNHARNIGFSISHRGPKTHNPRTQVLLAQRARPAHRVRSRSPSWVPRRARDDSGRRTSEALTGGSAQPSLPQMSLPGGRPYPRGRGGPARRLGGGHGDPNTTPRAARVLEARARVEAQRNRGSLA